jgi:hypothetical protein
MRSLDQGRASQNRELLLREGPDGTSPFELLLAGDYEKVLALIGNGPDRRKERRLPYSVGSIAAKKPTSPSTLLGALQDPVHQEKGGLLAVKAIKNTRRKM